MKSINSEKILNEMMTANSTVDIISNTNNILSIEEILQKIIKQKEEKNIEQIDTDILFYTKDKIEITEIEFHNLFTKVEDFVFKYFIRDIYQQKLDNCFYLKYDNKLFEFTKLNRIIDETYKKIVYNVEMPQNEQEIIIDFEDIVNNDFEKDVINNILELISYGYFLVDKEELYIFLKFIFENIGNKCLKAKAKSLIQEVSILEKNMENLIIFENSNDKLIMNLFDKIETNLLNLTLQELFLTGYFLCILEKYLFILNKNVLVEKCKEIQYRILK